MRLSALLTAALSLFVVVDTSAAQVGTEDFEAGNPDSWEIWFDVYNAIQPMGGNPGAYLELDNFTSGSATCDFIEFFPDRASTTLTHAGDWRAAGVDSVSCDLNIIEGLYLGDVTLKIINDAGTPGSTMDDCVVSFTSVGVGPAGPGWQTYTFAVPSADVAAPAGWEVDFNSPCSSMGLNAAWNLVMQNVDRIEFEYDGDPAFCAFTNWIAGIDNITVNGIGSSIGTNYCTANANSSGVAAAMNAAGSADAAANDVTLTSSGMPMNAFGFFLTSMTQGFVANPAGSDGNLCLGGSIGRYVGPGQIQSSGALGEISLQLDLTQHPTPMGFVTVLPGQTWNFTAWFRDSSPSGPTSNFADGYSIDFV